MLRCGSFGRISCLVSGASAIAQTQVGPTPPPAEIIVVQSPSPDPYLTFLIAVFVAWAAWRGERSRSRQNSLELQIVEAQISQELLEEKQRQDAERLQRQINQFADRLDNELGNSGLQHKNKRQQAQQKYQQMMQRDREETDEPTQANSTPSDPSD